MQNEAGRMGNSFAHAVMEPHGQHRKASLMGENLPILRFCAAFDFLVRGHQKMIADFSEALINVDPELARFGNLLTLQVNLGNRCNQSCAHCHLHAGPNGKKMMPGAVMEKIAVFLENHKGLCVDVTGGCPELNPGFRFFVESVCGLASRLMVRTNLTVLLEPGLEWIPHLYRRHRAVLCASLPCYTQQNVDFQRGQSVFEKSIAALKMLNALGYGGTPVRDALRQGFQPVEGNTAKPVPSRVEEMAVPDEGLELNLVYNPGGDFLPGPQEQLEADYKRELGTQYGIRFNKLFTMANAPIGRFRESLATNGRLAQYLKLLAANFNSAAAQNLMCRSLISVDYRGLVYNCDFNQALDLPIVDARGEVVTIERLDEVLAEGLEIITGEHCYCCTAGTGSSCTGSLVK